MSSSSSSRETSALGGDSGTKLRDRSLIKRHQQALATLLSSTRLSGLDAVSLEMLPVTAQWGLDRVPYGSADSVLQAVGRPARRNVHGRGRHPAAQRTSARRAGRPTRRICGRVGSTAARRGATNRTGRSSGVGTSQTNARRNE